MNTKMIRMKRKCPDDGFDEETYQPPKKRQQTISNLSEYYSMMQKTLYQIKPNVSTNVLDIILEYTKLQETNIELEKNTFDIIMVSFKSNQVKLFMDNHKHKHKILDGTRKYLWINANTYLQLEEFYS